MKHKTGIIEGAMCYHGIVAFLIALFVIVGIWGLVTMPKQEFPTFTIRQGIIVGVYPGATPSQMEAQLAKPLEQFLFTYKEVKKSKTYTMSRNGIVYAMVELEDDITNKDEVWSKIKHGLTLFKAGLPTGVLAVIANDDFGDTSALLISLESDTRSYRELEKYLDVLEGKLRRIESVSNLRRYGVQKEQISVYLNRSQLSAYGIDYQTLGVNLFSQGFTTVAGTVETEEQDIPLYFKPVFDSEKEVGEQIVYSDPTGKMVRLKDIATIIREYDNPDSYILTNGRKSEILSLEMRDGYNIVQYGKDVDAVLEAFNKIIPDDVTVERVVDQPELVDNSVSSFLRDLVIAIVIVILVMMILFPIRSAFVAAAMIPLTIFISIGIMYLINIPLNTVTLAALIVVLGMICDNAIVVIDGYLEYIKKGKSRWNAAVMSAKNYVSPIFIATLSICVIFFPLLAIFKGMWYDFVKDFPWAFSICLMVSFVLAILLTPFIEYMLIKKPYSQNAKKRKRIVDYVQSGYNCILKYCFKVPYLTIGAGITLVVISILFFFSLNIRLFPRADRNQFAIEVYLPQGIPLEKTKQVADSLYRILRQDERINTITEFIGTFSPRFHATYAPNIVAGKNYAQFVVNTTSNNATVELLNEYTEKYQYHFPEAFVRFKQLDFQQAAIPIEIRLSGENTAELKAYADSTLAVLGSFHNLVWLHTNYGEPLPSAEINIDPIQASRLGISRATAELGIASVYSDIPVSSIWEDDYNVIVKLKSERTAPYDKQDEIANQYINSIIPGTSVPLRQIATIKPNWEEGQIVRRNGVPSISILADVRRGASESKTYSEVRKVFEEKIRPQLPATIEVDYGGVQEYNTEVIPQIVQVILAGVFLIFLFLLFNYKKVNVSLAALLSLLFCIPGTVWGLWLTDTDFSITCILGVISLMGIIIRNAIMIFDHAENLRVIHKRPAREAAYEAGKRRMVPIFLTSATTAIGILPMIFGKTMLWTPMGIVVFSGTIVSMILAVTVLPVVYWKLFNKSINRKS